MSQTECGCNCHTTLFNGVIIICDDCKDEPCETVLMEQRMEGRNGNDPT